VIHAVGSEEQVAGLGWRVLVVVGWLVVFVLVVASLSSAAVTASAPMEEAEPVRLSVDGADCTGWGCGQYGWVVQVMCCRVAVAVKGRLFGSAVREGSLAAASVASALRQICPLWPCCDGSGDEFWQAHVSVLRSR